jgi:hypothetical protein
MAEIKSTLEKVMERVAAMGPLSETDVNADEIIKDGMRLAAEYLKGVGLELTTALNSHPEKNRKLLRSGIIKVLLRNIVLPRDDDQQAAELAMHGMLDLGRDSRNLITVLGETKEILGRYRQHRKQLREQLESAMRQQLKQALAQQGLGNNMPVNIDPTLHPKFQEEWQRIKDELNGQYGRALEQHKAMAAQLLGE